MRLFENKENNLLPFDGTVNYFGPVLDQNECDFYYNALIEKIEWKNDEAIIYGKHIITARKVAWYADLPYPYTYSRVTRNALVWTEELKNIKQKIEALTGETYNACLLNLYHNGNEGMAWHSDDEKTLKAGAAIASLSLGAERKFGFKHKKTGQTVSLILEHGSLLIMKDDTQQNWLHRLPPTKKIHSPRVNLTFRTMAAK